MGFRPSLLSLCCTYPPSPSVILVLQSSRCGRTACRSPNPRPIETKMQPTPTANRKLGWVGLWWQEWSGVLRPDLVTSGRHWVRIPLLVVGCCCCWSLHENLCPGLVPVVQPQRADSLQKCAGEGADSIHTVKSDCLLLSMQEGI